MSAKEHKVTCIVCPMGCEIKLKVKGRKIEDTQNARCSRGIKYAKQEYCNPQRVLTTTVKIKKGNLPLLPVRVDRPIAKSKLKECMRYLARVEVRAPVKLGQVIVSNILNTRANVISTRNMSSKKCS